jgi:hypothetical protein
MQKLESQQHKTTIHQIVELKQEEQRARTKIRREHFGTTVVSLKSRAQSPQQTADIRSLILALCRRRKNVAARHQGSTSSSIAALCQEELEEVCVSFVLQGYSDRRTATRHLFMNSS